MRFSILIGPLLLASVLSGCFRDDPQGTEVENELRTGRLYHADGRPAADAKISVYAIDYKPQDEGVSAKLTTVTDAQGRFRLDSLPNGEYNILGSHGGLFSYQDSVIVGTSTGSLPPDTLREAGSLAGVVSVQPHDDPRSVVVQVLGTHKYTNVDSEGRFVLSELAEGRYSLRLVTTMPDYAPLFAAVGIRTGRLDTLPDTLRLTYTGIPPVRNLKAQWDTLAGRVRLSWSPISYRGFFEYLVFSDLEPVLLPSDTADGAVMDTVFDFQAFTPAESLHVFPADTVQRVRRFQVRVRAGGSLGPIFEVARLALTPPGMFRTFIDLKSLVGTDAQAQIGDTVRIIAAFRNGRRTNDSLEWLVDGAAIPASSRRLSERSGKDTLTFALPFRPDTLVFRCRVRDESGRWWEDSLPLAILEKAPVVGISSLSGSGLEASIRDTVRLAVEFSNVRRPHSRLEWEQADVSTPLRTRSVDRDGRDTLAFRTPDSAGTYLIRMRVADSAGTYAADSVRILVVEDRPVAFAGRDTTHHVGGTLRLQSAGTDRFGTIRKWEWDVGATGIFAASSAETTITLSSMPSREYRIVLRVTDDDGFTGLDTMMVVLHPWVPRAPPKFARQWSAAAAVDGRIFLMGGTNNGDHVPNVEMYDTATGTWVEKAPMPTPRSQLTLAVVGKSVYAIGGLPQNQSSWMDVHDAEVYDTENDRWTKLPDYPHTHEGGHPGVAVMGDTLRVYGGGRYRYAAFYSDLDIPTGTWTLGSGMPAGLPQDAWPARTIPMGNRHFWTGEIDNPGVWNAYEPSTHTYHTHATMINRKIEFATAVAGNTIYVMGGAPIGTHFNYPAWATVEAYDRESNSWSQDWPLPQARRLATAVCLGKTVYLIGGVPSGDTRPVADMKAMIVED